MWDFERSTISKRLFGRLNKIGFVIPKAKQVSGYFSFPVGSGLARPGGVLEHLIWKAVSLDYLNMH